MFLKIQYEITEPELRSFPEPVRIQFAIFTATNVEKKTKLEVMQKTGEELGEKIRSNVKIGNDQNVVDNGSVTVRLEKSGYY